MKGNYLWISFLLFIISFSNITPFCVQSKEPGWIFETTIITPSLKYGYTHFAILLSNELPKIGISSNLIIVGYDVLIPRMMGSILHEDYAGGGFDIGVTRLRDTFIPANLFNFFHSSSIDSKQFSSNYYPVNNATLDGILERVMNTTEFNKRKEYIRQALDIIVWDIHPMTSVCQDAWAFYLRDNVKGLDPVRFPNIEEIYFQDGHSSGHGQVNELIIAAASISWNFNPLVAAFYTNEAFWYPPLPNVHIFRPTFAGLVERNENHSYVPGLLEQLPYPIAIKNNYTAEISSTDPNSATVWELKLRENVYWHEGYGYRMNNATHRDILRFDADDVVWFYKNCIIGDTVSDPYYEDYKEDYKTVLGTDPEKSVVKVDRYTVQIHLANISADLFTLFDIILPQHILDPTYDAFGFGPGVRADGTSAPAYANWLTDDFNMGYRTSGDTEYPAIIGNGAYTVLPVEEDKITFIRWSHYFKDNDTSFWQPLVEYSPDKCIFQQIANKDDAKHALETAEVDIMNIDYYAEKDYEAMKNKSGIEAIVKYDWGYSTLGYNILQGANDRLTNKWVRLAISHMIPRQDILHYFYKNLGLTNFAPFPRQSPYWPETLKPIEYNVTKALQYMEKAGYDMGYYWELLENNYQPTGSFQLPFFLEWPFVTIVIIVGGISLVLLIKGIKKLRTRN
ncbi:MAG: ABC transporter substrate-binding protein [Candidatus Hodarchaeota archaeon]